MQNKTFEANKKKYPGARIPKISYLTFCFLFFMDSKTVFFFVFLVFWFFSFLVFLGLVEAECTDMEEECTPDTVMDLVCLTMAQSIKTEVQTSLIVVGTTHFVKAEAFQTLHCNVFFSLFLRTPLVTCSVKIPLTYPYLVVMRSSHVGWWSFPLNHFFHGSCVCIYIY